MTCFCTVYPSQKFVSTNQHTFLVGILKNFGCLLINTKNVYKDSHIVKAFLLFLKELLPMFTSNILPPYILNGNFSTYCMFAYYLLKICISLWQFDQSYCPFSLKLFHQHVLYVQFLLHFKWEFLKILLAYYIIKISMSLCSDFPTVFLGPNIDPSPNVKKFFFFFPISWGKIPNSVVIKLLAKIINESFFK